MNPPRKRRADARHSRAAILDAATTVLNDQPDASVEAIAAAADVTRQTVYAHYPSRERLLHAVLARITESTAAAMDAALPDDGPAAEALLRVLDAAAGESARYPVLLQQINALPATPETAREQHTPIADRLARVIRRGQAAGEFDASLPLAWLVSVTIRLAHAAAEEAAGGRMSAEAATQARTLSLMRVLGARRAGQAGQDPA
ncbi:TetR/AcrR family transcriptional regulator [Nocardia sp. NPDC127579]|uniref:TetR/AcrR family transcriptional regulator n=1 Tax=Nocardia sp. NPDC127579 TaxID=3345402 RepID=UPI0036371910